MGISNLYSRLTQNDTFVSQAMPQVTAAAQMSMLMVFSSLYLAYISPISFFVTSIAIGVGISIFFAQSKLVKQSLKAVKKKETLYYNSISDMLHGFQEVKINQQKSQDILSDIALISKEARDIKISAGRKEARVWGFGRVFIYAILPILVFIIPSFSDEHASDIFKITATLLFITGPISILVSMLPVINRVNLVIEEMMNLEKSMDKACSSHVDDINQDIKEFDEIKMESTYFSYPNSNFSVGPIVQTIRSGELIFVVGGNGSGKSTLLKVLTGLYFPISGNLQIDGRIVNKENYQSYRSLYSVVFTDFHLFEKLYGIKDISNEQVNYWLKKMRMQHKVQYKDGAFTSTNLSTGQRKRLAFIAAILENRPILILDEFAADQDPQFRQYFYEELLLELKAEGRTIIAVTHDDHYFHVADRVLKMDSGKLIDYV
jgi:putative ATP-binding cassette transporter